MENESLSSKETPCFDDELKKWLALYSIGAGPHKLGDVRDKLKRFLGQEIVPLILVNLISDFQSGDCVKSIVRNDPVYKKEGNIIKCLGNIPQYYYFLTQKGKKQLLFGWEFAGPSISKDFYKEISNSLCAICQS